MSEIKEIKIQVPDGYEIDKVNSTFEKIVLKKIVLKKIENQLPISWKDLGSVTGYYATNGGNYPYIENTCGPTLNENNKLLFPSKEEAEAMLAMAQLCQLRDV